MKTKWAILGPGTIAHKFADGLKIIEDAELHAVGEVPKFYDRAKAFANEYAVEKVYESAEALCSDDEVDVVYVSMVNTMHLDAVLTCLGAGKHVLCEKPIGLNTGQLKQMIACAREHDAFLMEAFWTSFIPSIVKTKEWLSSGQIGEVRSISAEFGFRVGDRSGRHFNKALGGGVLLDVGTYTIGIPLIVMGSEPATVSSRMYISNEGVDESESIFLDYGNGRTVRIYNSFGETVRHDLYVYGTDGYVYVPDFWHATKAQLFVGKDLRDEFDEPFETSGYNFEAEHVMQCLRDGKKESDVVPHSLSLSIMGIMDDVRAMGGLRFEGE